MIRPATVTHEYYITEYPRIKELIALLTENFGQDDMILTLELGKQLVIRVQTNDL